MSDKVKTFRELTADQQPYAGGKGGALARMFQAGYPVPDGFLILPTAFVDDALAPDAWIKVQAQLDRLRSADPSTAFAVRSSAMSEDSAQASFAGEFETVLNVRTDEEVRDAIRSVYHSRQSERVQAYSQARGMAPTAPGGGHEIAVVVQRLVHAHASGVLFTANPLTGQRDQAMISAAWGLGEAIVGGLVTPDTLLVDKPTGRVVERQTADKEVMTVLLGSGTEEQPVPDALRHEPVLSDAQAAELVALGVQIETLYNMPMDVEWTLSQQGEAAEPSFAIVQARPITALPPAPTERGTATLSPPAGWKLPQGSYMAIRNNIVELMAEPLSPLFRTLGLAAVNASMHRLLGSFFGKADLMPEEIIIAVNQYAYYNGSWSAGQLARILLRSVGITKYMFTGAVERWTEEGRPRYVATVEQWQATEWRELPATELLAAARLLTEAAIDAYGAMVSGLIPAAWISEALFTMTYRRLIKRRNDPEAPIYLLGYDSLPILAEKSLYDLAQWVRGRAGLAAYVAATPAGQLAADLEREPAPARVAPADWQEWEDGFHAHLQRYGHTIYNLDFANPVPGDDPAPLLEACKLFVQGQGVNPHERQRAAAKRRDEATLAMLNRLGGLRLKLFRKCLAPAQRYAPLREDALADVGLGYPLLRQMLRELGHRFVVGAAIDQPDDIYWLEQDEVEQAATRLEEGHGLEYWSERVGQRRAAWAAANQLTPPRSLPQRQIPGLAKLKAALSTGREEEVLKGVAASPGSVTAPARVLGGPEDFAEMQAGDVLVAAITTPAWTPLFVRAAAIVTDVGGPLSHGSIVAREYGIPAVLGTGSATRRIRSGQIVTVDGTAGTVTLSGNGGEAG
jgi:phosphohistidine swiveling domain-containing protein